MNRFRRFLLWLAGGIGSLEIWPSRDYPSPGTFADDAEKLRGDWQKVGDDMQRAIDKAGRP